MPRYTVRDGHSFDLGGGKTAVAGDEIELEEDVARMHADRVDPVKSGGDAGVQTPALRDDLES
jgi:hypothetical protein